MTHYRFYVLGADNRIIGAVDLHYATDECAEAAASEMLRNGRAIEVWQGSRLVWATGQPAGNSDGGTAIMVGE